MVTSPAPLGMAQRLDNFEDYPVAERRIRHLELALAHHALSQLPCVEFAVCLQMAQANVCNLPLLKEAVADYVLSALLLAPLDQADHRIDVRQVVSRPSELGLISRDDAADLGALLLESLDDERIGHAPLKPKSDQGHQPTNGCLLHITELLASEQFSTLHEF
jgi:hypothetical protein